MWSALKDLATGHTQNETVSTGHSATIRKRGSKEPVDTTKGQTKKTPSKSPRGNGTGGPLSSPTTPPKIAKKAHPVSTTMKNKMDMGDKIKSFARKIWDMTVLAFFRRRLGNAASFLQTFEFVTWVTMVVALSMSLRILVLPSPVYDDDSATQNPMAKGNLPLGAILTHDFWGTDMILPHSHRSWRPLATILYRLLNGISRFYGFSLLFQHELLPYRLTSVLLYWICAFLIYKCILSLLKHMELDNYKKTCSNSACFACCWWLATPLHAETLAQLVGIADMVATALVLFATYTWIISLQQKTLHTRKVLKLIGLCTAALLSKETGISGLGILFAAEVFLNTLPLLSSYTYSATGDSKTRSFSKSLLHSLIRVSISRCGMLVASVFVLLIMRMLVMGGSPPPFPGHMNPFRTETSRLRRMLIFSYLAARHVLLLLIPFPLNHDWSDGSISHITSVWDPRNILTVAVFVVVLAIGVFFLRWLFLGVTKPQSKQNLGRSTGFAFALCASIIPFIPASNLFFPVGFVLAERAMFMPSAFVAVFFGLTVFWIIEPYNRQPLIGRLPGPVAKWSCCAIGCVFIWLAFSLYGRIGDHISVKTLDLVDIKTSPGNSKLWYDLGSHASSNSEWWPKMNSTLLANQALANGEIKSFRAPNCSDMRSQLIIPHIDNLLAGYESVDGEMITSPLLWYEWENPHTRKNVLHDYLSPKFPKQVLQARKHCNHILENSNKIPGCSLPFGGEKSAALPKDPVSSMIQWIPFANRIWSRILQNTDSQESCVANTVGITCAEISLLNPYPPIYELSSVEAMTCALAHQNSYDTAISILAESARLNINQTEPNETKSGRKRYYGLLARLRAVSWALKDSLQLIHDPGTGFKVGVVMLNSAYEMQDERTLSENPDTLNDRMAATVAESIYFARHVSSSLRELAFLKTSKNSVKAWPAERRLHYNVPQDDSGCSPRLALDAASAPDGLPPFALPPIAQYLEETETIPVSVVRVISNPRANLDEWDSASDPVTNSPLLMTDEEVALYTQIVIANEQRRREHAEILALTALANEENILLYPLKQVYSDSHYEWLPNSTVSLTWFCPAYTQLVIAQANLARPVNDILLTLEAGAHLCIGEGRHEVFKEITSVLEQFRDNKMWDYSEATDRINSWKSIYEDEVAFSKKLASNGII